MQSNIKNRLGNIFLCYNMSHNCLHINTLGFDFHIYSYIDTVTSFKEKSNVGLDFFASSKHRCSSAVWFSQGMHYACFAVVYISYGSISSKTSESVNTQITLFNNLLIS